MIPKQPKHIKIAPTASDDAGESQPLRSTLQGHNVAAQVMLGIDAKKDFALSAARLLCTAYYLITVPLRLCFFESYTYGTGAALALTIPDCLADIFFMVQLLQRLRSQEAYLVAGDLSASGHGEWFALPGVEAPKTDEDQTEINVAALKGIVMFKRHLNATRKYGAAPTVCGQDPAAAHPKDTDPPTFWEAATGVKYRAWRRNVCRLVYETVATVPMEAVASAFGAPRLGPYMVNRLLRIMFLHREFKHVIRYLEDQQVMTNVMVQRTWQLFFATGMCGHWGACCFFLVGKYDVESGILDTWLTRDQLAEVTDAGEVVWRTGRARCYSRSLYWAVDTLITTGFGNVAPVTMHETILCIVFIYVCIFTAASAVSNLTLLVTMADHARTEFQLKMDAINKYMVYRRLPVALKQRITSFFEYRWQVLKGVDERHFLEELPPSLRQQVTNHLTRDHLKSLPLLRNAGNALLNALAVHVESYVYSPHDDIIKPGEPLTGALLVSRGEMEVLTDKGIVEAKLGAGGNYGAECLVNPASSRHLVRAKTFLEVFVLPASAFNAVYLRLSGKERLQEFRSKIEQTSRSRGKAVKLVGGGNAADELISQLRGFRRLCVPDSLFRRTWDVALFCGVTFYAVATPLHMSWLTLGLDFRQQAWLLVPGYVADAFFVADLVLHGRFFFFLEEGLLVYEPDRIWHRFRNSHGPVREVLAALPVDLLALIFGPFWLSLLRLPKALRLLQLRQALDRMQHVVLASEKAVGINARRFLGLNLAMVLACHWVGCLWMLVGRAGPLLGFKRNWIDIDQDNPDSDIVFSNAGHTAGYLRAVYFALFTMSTEGYPDITDTNMLETNFLVFALLGGGMLMPAVVGGLASLMANIQKASKEYRDKISDLRLSMERQRYPVELRERVLHYYDYLWGRQGGVQEELILDELPAPLRRKVAMHVNGDTLRRVPFFTCDDERLYEYIVAVLQPRIFLPRDVVIKCGEVGKEMYMIEAGTVVVQSHNLKLTYVALGRGSYFGESCLLVAAAHCASVVARGYVDTFVLSKADFYAVTEAYPEWQEAILDALRGDLQDQCRSNEHTASNLGQSQKLRSHLDVAAAEVMAAAAAAVAAQKARADAVLALVAEKCGVADSGGSGVRGGSGGGGYSGACGGSGSDGDDGWGSSRDRTKSATSWVRAGTEGKHLSRGNSVATAVINARQRASVAAGSALEAAAALIPRRLAPGGATFHPDSVERSLWDLAVFLTLTFNLVAIPWCLAFLPSFRDYGVLWALDLVFWADMYLRAVRFAVVRDGQLRTDRDAIWAHYAGPGGRLHADLAATLPYDVLALFCFVAPGTLPVVMAALRVPRVLRLPWAGELAASLGRAAQALGVPTTPMELMQLLGVVLIMAHWAGCGLYVVARLRNGGADCAGLEKDDAVGTNGLSAFGTCRWSMTWVGRQVRNEQLPPDGGEETTLYIRAVNWALPTLVTASIGDTPMANYGETLYVFLWILFGLTINAIIIGNVASLVANLDSKQAQYFATADALKRYMNRNDVPMATRARVNGYMGLVWARHGGLLEREDDEFEDLPLTLRQLVCEHSRIRHLRQCPGFDFCSDEVMRGLAMGMQRQVYAQGDIIVHCGEAGFDMFFVDVGSVQILGPDEEAVLATLTAGAFFGETAIFFKTERSATVCAAEFCELYVLAKEVLDRELAFVDYPIDKMAEAFLVLQGANRRRNEAVRANLLRSAEPASKLHKLVDVNRDKAKGRRFRAFLLPSSSFRFAWETLSTLFICYTAFVLPYRIAFVIDDTDADDGAPAAGRSGVETALVALEWVIEGFFFMDIVLRYNLFPSSDSSGAIITDPLEIRQRYRATWLWKDLAASLPMDLVVQLAGRPEYVLVCSLPRLLRLMRLPGHLGQLDYYCTAVFRLSLSISVRLLAKVFACYLFLNHWYGCVWFLIHRYESHRALTWATFDRLATFDAETGRHNVCDVGRAMCYVRSVYFAINTLGTVGYGDQMPFTTLETLWEWVVVLTGACMVASVVGAFTAFFQFLDTSGDSAFKEKMAHFSVYMTQRKLPPDLQHAVRVHHNHLWRKSKVLDEAALMAPLSVPLRMELHALVRERAVAYCPAIAGCSPAMRKRLCVVLRPQACLQGGSIYQAEDVGPEVYFVTSGIVRVKLSAAEGLSGAVGPVATALARNKAAAMGDTHTPGNHFGEWCLITPSRVRPDTACAATNAELFVLDKDLLDDLLRYLPERRRRAFVEALVCRNGRTTHSPDARCLGAAPDNSAYIVLLMGRSKGTMALSAAVGRKAFTSAKRRPGSALAAGGGRGGGGGAAAGGMNKTTVMAMHIAMAAAKIAAQAKAAKGAGGGGGCGAEAGEVEVDRVAEDSVTEEEGSTERIRIDDDGPDDAKSGEGRGRGGGWGGGAKGNGSGRSGRRNGSDSSSASGKSNGGGGGDGNSTRGSRRTKAAAAKLVRSWTDMMFTAKAAKASSSPPLDAPTAAAAAAVTAAALSLSQTTGMALHVERISRTNRPSGTWAKGDTPEERRRREREKELERLRSMGDARTRTQEQEFLFQQKNDDVPAAEGPAEWGGA